ncbi:MAG: type II secretion system F family protein, partial [Planctomycetaceae bacterium]|nr:type II secretion system F family protein [Planctomycetaceae bacterium]
MLPLVVFIANPSLGALLLLAEHNRRHGETRFARRAGRTMLVVTGGIAALSGVAILVLLAVAFLLERTLVSLHEGVLLTITASLVALLFFYAAVSALRIGLKNYPRDSIDVLTNEARDSDNVQLAGWLLVLTPLMLMGVLGLGIMLPMVVTGVVYWSARQSRESQFLWTLALAVEYGLPLDDEIDSFSRTLWSRNRKRYGDIAARIREGRTLIDALEIGGGLPRPLVAELRSAQAAGTLPQALRRMAAASTTSLLQNRFDISIAITTCYLWVLVTIVFSVVGFLMYWIIPKFKDIFNDFDVDLPDWTVRAIHFSDLFADYFYLAMPLVSVPIFSALIGVIVGIAGWGNLNFPLLMRWFPRRDAPGLLASLAYTVDAGQPIPPALEDMAEHQPRSDLRERLLRMQRLTDLGHPLTTVMASEGFIRDAEAGALDAA